MSAAQRTPEEISAELAETRNRLAGTIDQLAYRAKPKTIVQRQLASAKASFYDASGQLRRDRVLKVAGVTVALVAGIVALRKIVG